MEPGSQLTSVLNRNKIQVSKKGEAEMHTQKEKEERKMLILRYKGSLECIA